MKYSLLKKTFLTVGMIFATFLCGNASLTSEFHAPNSVLSSGYWVKIGVDKSGLYEISYTQLREMGFSNPEKVALFGRGGKMLDINFVDDAGNIMIDNDLAEVPVTHSDNKLIFYGIGPENYVPTQITGFELPINYINNKLNIYSKRGYYFLTEKETPLVMKTNDATDSTVKLTEGVGHVWHELDLQHNNSRSGQFFWGESLLGNNSYREWNVTLDDAIIGKKANVNCMFYPESGAQGHFQYGLTDSNDNCDILLRGTTVFYFTSLQPSAFGVTINSRATRMFARYISDNNDEDFANIDYWSITYPRTIPSLVATDGSLNSQDLITFYGLDSNPNAEFIIPGGFSFKAIDVTNPTLPCLVNVQPYGKDGKASFRATSENPSVVIFDSKRPLMQVSGYDANYKALQNQNLHALAKEGAELLIITVPLLREQAEKIAELHRIHDGINVIVATVEEIYNEFSSGTPDPMAYRNFARMIYDAPQHQLKNILLFGPMNNDVRGIVVERDPMTTIIAYQSPEINIEKGAMNINDYYGMMSDRITDSIESVPMEVGVGVLPCAFVSDAECIAKKIEDYILNEDHAYTLNELLNIGGIGDNHTHDQQAIDIGNYINISNSNHLVVSNLAIDAYGNQHARKKMFEYFNSGKGLVTYFGHGSTTMLGKDKFFFSGDNVREFRNNRLPFMLFAGCVLTNFDRGQRGIAESMVLSTPYGLIGSLAATRDTWSGQNLDLMKIFLNRMYKDGVSVNSPRLTTALTIGEVYARTKSQSEYNNELAYHLICDPALVIPIANRRIQFKSTTMSAKPGEQLTVDGNVLTINNNIDKTFNGNVVLKLMEPTITLKSEDLATVSENKTNILEVPYSDYLITEVVARVENGHFETAMQIPAYMTKFNGAECNLLATAYDPNLRLGAGSRIRVTISGDASELDPSLSDTTPPVIERFQYDESTKCLNVTVSDDTALDLSQSPFSNGFFMTIDEKSYNAGSLASKSLEYDRPAYSKCVNVAHLPLGTHTAAVNVKDANGNSASMNISFTISEKEKYITLCVDESIVDDSCKFTFEGQPVKPKLVIVDVMGNKVFEKNISGIEYIWNRLDSNGNRLSPGLYKAFIIETGQQINKTHSNTVEIPVI